MKVKVGSLKLLRGGFILFALVVAGVLSFILFIHSPNKSPSTENGEENDGVSELSQPTDYYAPSIDELEQRYQDPAAQYERALFYANAKSEVQKYKEAVVFYEFAAKVAPDEDARKETEYKLYILGMRTNNSNLSTKYKDIIGQNYIDAKLVAVPRDQ